MRAASSSLTYAGPAWFPTASFRSLVLPKEHGSWSFALEPLALGLLVAPSPAGFTLAASALAGFFLRRPLKLFLTLPHDDPRRPVALGWSLACLVVAAATFAWSIALGAWGNHWPLLLCLPCGALFLWSDWQGETRQLGAELAGSLTFSLLPATLVLLDGWNTPAALALTFLSLARSLPTLLTVRTGLRRAKGEPVSAIAALGTAGVSTLATFALAQFGLVPPAVPFVVVLLLLRTGYFLSPFRPGWTARQTGMFEAGLGLLFLAGISFAYRFV